MKRQNRSFYDGQNINVFHFYPKNKTQEYLYDCLLNDPLVVAIGPAGTGKSYTMASAALKAYQIGKINKIIVLRNPIPTGSSLGFFPGSEEEKLAVWCKPILETFRKIVQKEEILQYLLNKKYLTFNSLETLKGISYDDAFIIVEETQELPFEVIKMLATRVGDGSTICFNGDLDQSNGRLKDYGFREFVNKLEKYEEALEAKVEQGIQMPEWAYTPTPIVAFNKDDIVRSPLCRKMVDCLY